MGSVIFVVEGEKTFEGCWETRGIFSIKLVVYFTGYGLFIESDCDLRGQAAVYLFTFFCWLWLWLWFSLRLLLWQTIICFNLLRLSFNLRLRFCFEYRLLGSGIVLLNFEDLLDREDGFFYFGLDGEVGVKGEVGSFLVCGLVLRFVEAEVDVIGLPVVGVEGVDLVVEDRFGLLVVCFRRLKRIVHLYYYYK